jgi:hypothetical protein
MVGLFGALVGLALAGAAGWLLGSWLVFVLCVLPLMVSGLLIGMAWDMDAHQKRIIAHPEVIDGEVAKLMNAGKWREASQRLLFGAKMVEQAAKAPRPDREALLALARRWHAQARVCIDRYTGVHGLFRD